MQATLYLKSIDQHLNRIISSVSMPTLQWSGDVFEDLVSCILDMQIRYRGNAVRYKKMKQLLNGAQITHKNLFSIDDEGLQHMNMSGQKYKALMNLCIYWEEQRLDNTNWHSLNDNEVRNILTKIKGVGNWTIDMILLFTLQRENIFPKDDFHLKKIMKRVYEISEDKNLEKEMQYIAEDWQPYSSIAVLYLLAFKKNENSQSN
ncbi:DNA-3-methyladenine glycosylase family protein [Maribacter sp.]